MMTVEEKKIREREKYHYHKHQHRDRLQKWHLLNRQRNFFNICEYHKTHPCIDCGESGIIVLDFDHREGENKLRTISSMKHWSCWDTIKAEIDKCDVRCANCHRRKTARDFNHYRDINRYPAREKVLEYLQEHFCVDCGETDFIILDFDHRIGEKKKNGISALVTAGYCWDTVKKEIDKCDVRCANCHRKKTAVDFKWYKNKQQGIAQSGSESSPWTRVMGVQIPLP